MPQALPTLQPSDYSSAPETIEQSPIEQYLENNPYLATQRGDFRDRAISRKKNIGDPDSALDWYHWGDANEGYEPYLFENPDYGQYLTDLAYREKLLDRIEDLRTGGPNTDYMMDSIYDDMKYIKSGGQTNHAAGQMTPSNGLQYDYGAGTYLNPERLSPKTAEMIAKGITQDRPEYADETGEKTGLNPLINQQRRRLGLLNHIPSGGAYMQGAY